MVTQSELMQLDFSDAQMHYHPDGLCAGDPCFFQQDGLLHCIFMQYLRPGSKRDKAEHFTLGHAVSKDLISWKPLPNALNRGAPGSYDDLEMWRAYTIRHGDLIYLFYTARSSRKPGVQSIALATSKDGINFERYPGNPILSPDARWYHNESDPIRLGLLEDQELRCDCRDFGVARDPDGNGYWGVFSARQRGREYAQTTVVGLAHSRDLIHWEQFPPCFAPNKYAGADVPHMFHLDGRWYLILYTGNVYGQRKRASDPNLIHSTIYAVADRPQGPFRELDSNILIGSVERGSIACMTTEVDGEPYLFFSQGECRSGDVQHGTISLPQRLKTDAQGHLIPCYTPRIEKYVTGELFGSTLPAAIPSTGQFGSIGTWIRNGTAVEGHCATDWALHVFDKVGGDLLYTGFITIADARSAGFAFRIQGNQIWNGGMYLVLLDAEAQEVLFTETREFPRIEARRWEIMRGQRHFLRILASGPIVHVYIDDVLALQLHHPAFAAGRFGLFVEQGKAKFESISAVELGRTPPAI